ncbi:helix-hairpin-helix domain-containing protein [Tenacibaculum sp. nBUS_03]|uniref:helix-hairpin-helix domain-containing protein n=1 Tax=Tenacibaculum sp. nBUS_03 TaxID=3395320 RepID=UPI003EB75165
MKIFKSHFWYIKSQRNGVFFLVILVFILQVTYVFVNFHEEDSDNTDKQELAVFLKEIDSLREHKLKKRKPKLYSFNPNYISDYRGYKLGMSLEEIDKLLEYRKKGRFVNSKEEFQRVTNISDSLLTEIAPYFKFPDWVIKKNLKNRSHTKDTAIFNAKVKVFKEVSSLSTTDINRATLRDLLVCVKDVRLAEKLINYRKKIQGFTFESQLNEVYGIEDDVVKNILNTFKILQKPQILKVNVNTATFKEILKNPYIDYTLCKKIFDYKEEVAEIQNITELKNISGFPLKKYHRIVLYLKAK